MKFTSAVLALIASTGIVNALPEAVAGGKWSKHHSLTSSCWTSSKYMSMYQRVVGYTRSPNVVVDRYTSICVRLYTQLFANAVSA